MPILPPFFISLLVSFAKSFKINRVVYDVERKRKD